MFAVPLIPLQEFLAALPDLAARSQSELVSGDFTLERIRSLLAALGKPQQKYRSIHVAGTNGKGSVCALCASALQAQGYSVGLFTSPHVLGALQGIQVDGQVIAQPDLEETFQLISPHLKFADGWTQFEIVTALAFMHLARAQVETAVIEVGLGGRLDATNVLKPLISVITSIDYDHTSILGKTLVQIAREKAGIIKPGVPLVLAPQPEEARAAILQRAKELEAPVTEIGKDLLFERRRSDLRGQDLRVWPANSPAEVQALHISFLGAYQIENAATAYAALQVANQQGLRVDAAAIQRGFAAARWPGRFELLQDHPPLVLDAAHTPAAARALRQSLDEYFPGREMITVLGISADKDLEKLLKPLKGRLDTLIATQSSHPRAMPAGQLADRLAKLGIPSVAEPDAGRALKTALKSADESTLVLIMGSVFLVEWVREIYFKQR